MVPTTWTALLLLCIAVLPGATFTFGFERQASAYGVTLADRVLRFVAVSVAVDALLSWPVYLAYRAWFADRAFAGGQFAAVWALAVVGAVGPTTLGNAVGRLYRTRANRPGWRWLRLVRGPNAAPRAWDHLFSDAPTAYLRVRTTAGTWLAGLFASNSYAGKFPHTSDLWLEQAWPVTDAGILGDEALGYPLYIPAATIAYVEVVHATEEAAYA